MKRYFCSTIVLMPHQKDLEKYPENIHMVESKYLSLMMSCDFRALHICANHGDEENTIIMQAVLERFMKEACLDEAINARNRLQHVSTTSFVLKIVFPDYILVSRNKY